MRERSRFAFIEKSLVVICHATRWMAANWFCNSGSIASVCVLRWDRFCIKSQNKGQTKSQIKSQIKRQTKCWSILKCRLSSSESFSIPIQSNWISVKNSNGLHTAALLTRKVCFVLNRIFSIKNSSLIDWRLQIEDFRLKNLDGKL